MDNMTTNYRAAADRAIKAINAAANLKANIASNTMQQRFAGGFVDTTQEQVDALNEIAALIEKASKLI